MERRILAPLIAISSLIYSAPLSANITLPAGKLNHFEQYITSIQNAPSEFDQILQKYPNIVVDFYAVWCGPCTRMTPTLESLASEFTNVIFIKINIGTFKTISDRYGVQSIPTLLFFKNGTVVTRTTGLKSKSEVTSRLNTIFS